MLRRRPRDRHLARASVRPRAFLVGQSVGRTRAEPRHRETRSWVSLACQPSFQMGGLDHQAWRPCRNRIARVEVVVIPDGDGDHRGDVGPGVRDERLGATERPDLVVVNLANASARHSGESVGFRVATSSSGSACCESFIPTRFGLTRAVWCMPFSASSTRLHTAHADHLTTPAICRLEWPGPRSKRWANDFERQ